MSSSAPSTAAVGLSLFSQLQLVGRILPDSSEALADLHPEGGSPLRTAGGDGVLDLWWRRLALSLFKSIGVFCAQETAALGQPRGRTSWRR